MQTAKESEVFWFELSVESEDGKDNVVIKLFDTTVSLSRHVESIFQTIERNAGLKKYSVIKIKKS